MLKLFVYKKMPGESDSKLLRLLKAEGEYDGKIFQKIATAPFAQLAEFVPTVEEAHYIMMPSDYVYFLNNYGNRHEYLEKLDAFAALHNKKIIVTAYGDTSSKIPLTNAIVLRSSAYRCKLSPNEIIVPAFIEDLGAQYEIVPRRKSKEIPIVGFAGMVKLPSLMKEVKYQIRMLLMNVQVLLGIKQRAETQGLYFRRIFVKELSETDSCQTNFIIRNSFSAHEETMSKDPVTLRREYIDVLQNSDLGLVIRGDGNFSLRFFEVLSLGRVPLFIDTDTPLPFENEIDYDSFMLRIDYSDINNLSSIIKNFWDNLSEPQFMEMQVKARNVFESQLRPDVFYKLLFKKLEAESDFSEN